jgi:hypothetical protein
VSRPSRSQQLRNPKLVPKLTNETLNPLEKKYVGLTQVFSLFTNDAVGKVLRMRSCLKRKMNARVSVSVRRGMMN